MVPPFAPPHPAAPPLSSRRRRRFTALESSTDPRGSITITITQMCAYTSWLVRDSSNCPRQIVWGCTLYAQERGAAPREQHIYDKSWDGVCGAWQIFFYDYGQCLGGSAAVSTATSQQEGSAYVGPSAGTKDLRPILPAQPQARTDHRIGWRAAATRVLE